MPAKKLDFVRKGEGGFPCEQGADFSYQLVWEKVDETQTPPDSDYEDYVYIPVPMPGYQARMQVRKDQASPFIVELTTENGRIILGATDGTITLRISAAVTTPLVPGLYKYDLELIDNNGYVTRFIYGAFEVSANITE